MFLYKIIQKKIIVVGVFILLVGGLWYVQSGRYGEFMKANNLSSSSEIKLKDNLSVLVDKNVPLVKPTEIIELKNGDTFVLTASIVKQQVGNRTIKRLAYNGQIPGPILKVQKGAKVTVNFINNIDMETSLHSHGLRGDYRYDGAPPLSQDPIPVGGNFTYQLEFPDAGVYWYHPHVREDYQQELGLYGNFIVEEPGYWSPVDKEEYLILDDVLENGDFSLGGVTNTLMGRFGNTLLINDQEDFTLQVNQGEITRLYLTNAANTRTFDMSFTGAKTKLVGGDNGRIEHEVVVNDVILGPSERSVLEVLYEKPGTYPIMHRGKKMGTVVVNAGEVNHVADFKQLRNSASDYSTIRANVNSLLAQNPDKRLRLDIEMKGVMGDMMQDMGDGKGSGMRMSSGSNNDDMMREHCQMMPEMAGCESYLTSSSSESVKDDSGIEWEDNMSMMNQMSTNENIKWIIEDQDTNKQNHEINWLFKRGDLVKVQIYNDEKGIHPMQHPIHFHGQRFVVLARDGVANDNLQWKDTVLIPKGQTIDLLIDMSNPGKWMAHCHIAEHLETGMMFDFEVK